MNTLSDAVAIRPDFIVSESDAAPGEIGIVIEHQGRRVCRLDVDVSMYRPEMAAAVLAQLQAQTPSPISLIR